MSSYRNVVTPSDRTEHLLGRVKWFNNKAGYGFVTVTDGARSGSDVFVHHTAINVENQQYKYLVQGEYVEFDLIKVESDKHEWQASQVAGIKGGKLMCETRHDLKIARNEYKATKSGDETPVAPRQKVVEQRQKVVEQRQKVVEQRQKNSQRKNSAQKVSPGNTKEWTLVGDKGKPQTRQPRQQVKKTSGSTIVTIQSK